MRLFCNICDKSVSNEVPDDIIIRAALVCPECIEAKRVAFPVITWGYNAGEEQSKK